MRIQIWLPALALVGLFAALPLGPFQLDGLSAGPLAALLLMALSAPKTAGTGPWTALFALGAGLALCAQSPLWALAGLALALVALSRRGGGPGAWVGAILCLGAAGYLGGWVLDPLADPDSLSILTVHQLRGGGAALGAVAVALFLTRPWRAERPESTLWALAAVAGLGRGLGVATPEALRLAAPILLYGAAALALLAVAFAARRSSGLAPLAASVALAGLASTTTAGAGAAALALTLGLLSVRGTAARSAADSILVAGLGLAALVASWAAITVALPGLKLPALVASAGIALALVAALVTALRGPRAAAEIPRRLAAVVACVLAILGGCGLLPAQASAQAWAARASGNSMPVDDVGGYRRLWLRETAHAAPGAEDAGVP